LELTFSQNASLDIALPEMILKQAGADDLLNPMREKKHASGEKKREGLKDLRGL
jgi:hypothetical protein